MTIRFGIMTFVGIGLTAALLQACVGNELSRRRAFELLSAELARQGPVQHYWHLGSTTEIRTPDRKPNIDLQKVASDLEVLMLMRDDQYSDLLKGVPAVEESGPTVHGIQVAHPAILDMRKLWKSGQISRFAWTSESQPFWGGYLLSVVGVIKPEFRSQCDGEPYRERDKKCVRIVAERKVKSISGIRDFEEFVRVEFEVTITPTSAGKSLGRQTVTRTSAANFVLYDDGWRVLYATFPDD